MKKALLPILLISFTSVIAQAARTEYSAHQLAAIRAGESTIGPILVCNLSKIGSDGSVQIIDETARNPQFGIIPNRPLTLLSDSVTGYVMIQSPREGEALVQLNLFSKRKEGKIDETREVARIVRQGMSFLPTPVSEATLTTKITSSGEAETYKLNCSVSLNSVSDD
jgi:hypothetical protein